MNNALSTKRVCVAVKLAEIVIQDRLPQATDARQEVSSSMEIASAQRPPPNSGSVHTTS